MQQLHYSHAKMALVKPYAYPQMRIIENRMKFCSHSQQGKSWKDEKMNLFTSYKNWKRTRQTFNQLSALSNHQLYDLGIGREDITYIARRGRRS